MSTRIENVRFTFPNVHTAKQVNGQGDPKFSVSALLEKNHPQLPAIVAAIKEAAVKKWGAKAQETLKALQASDRLPLHDGDVKADYDGYAGLLFINASNKVRPLVIGPQRQPLEAADGKPYSGCYGNIIVEFWAQDNQFGKRVNASLLGVQFTRDGERLAGGGVAAADDFEAIPDKDSAEVETSGKGATALF